MGSKGVQPTGCFRITYNGKLPAQKTEKPELITLENSTKNLIKNTSVADSTSSSNLTSRSGHNSMPPGGLPSRSVCTTERTAWTSVSNPKLETLFEQKHPSLAQTGKTQSEGNLGKKFKNINLKKEIFQIKRSLSTLDVCKAGRKCKTMQGRKNGSNFTGIPTEEQVKWPNRRRNSVASKQWSSVAIAPSVKRFDRPNMSAFRASQSRGVNNNSALRTNNDNNVKYDASNNKRADDNNNDNRESLENGYCDLCYSDGEREQRIIQWLLSVGCSSQEEVEPPVILPTVLEIAPPIKTDTAIHIVYDDDA